MSVPLPPQSSPVGRSFLATAAALFGVLTLVSLLVS